MKVLVVGGGGRCHAIADALRRSPKVEKIYVAPGNAGTAEVAENVPLKDTDVQGLLAFAQKKDIDLTVVGPEAALQAGIVDEFRSHGLRIFGPTAAAARIETSKEFAKELMMRYDIPTAAYRPFDDYREALDYVASRPLPAVLKYDGLAAGKGVVIARKIVLSGICECSILTRCLPRTVLMAETKRIKKVVVLIPPPVEAGEAPMNIRMITRSKVGLSTWPKSTELNPAVREEADWKNETTILPPKECSCSEWFHSKTMKSTVPSTIRKQEVKTTIRVLRLHLLFTEGRNLLRESEKISFNTGNPIPPRMANTAMMIWSM